MMFSNEILTSLIFRHYPNLNSEPRFSPIRTGKFNTSYWVDLDHDQIVLRIAPPDESVFVFYEAKMMHQEPALHALLRSETSLPVAKILAFDAHRDLIDRDYLLMERLPGYPLTEAINVDYDYVLWQIGKYLAELHKLQDENYGYLGEHHPMEPESNWADAFQVMWNKMINDISTIGYYNKTESSFMRSLLDDRLEYFHHPAAASLLHMDIWHQNILVDQTGKITGIVDWDRALWGDPEIEFSVLDYCGISTQAFWEGYGKPRDNSPDTILRNAFYLLYELQKYIVIRHGRNHAPQRAKRYQVQVLNYANQIANSGNFV